MQGARSFGRYLRKLGNENLVHAARAAAGDEWQMISRLGRTCLNAGESQYSTGSGKSAAALQRLTGQLPEEGTVPAGESTEMGYAVS